MAEKRLVFIITVSNPKLYAIFQGPTKKTTISLPIMIRLSHVQGISDYDIQEVQYGKVIRY
jgi:hypothetical protein